MNAAEFGRQAQDAIIAGVGRRGFLRAAAAVGATGVTAPLLSGGSALAEPSRSVKVTMPGEILQPGTGPIHGDHYLQSLPDQVTWGYVPSLTAQPVLRMKSGETVTVDGVSHEGILEDQGRDPVAYFGSKGVPADQVLNDVIAIAAGYSRTRRNFDADGPHVVTGPIYVDGAAPGDVLKVEMLSFMPRVPYGVVSSRHGKGALPRLAGGGVPAGITLSEIMPPVSTDGRSSGVPTQYGNVSVFTPVKPGKDGHVGAMPGGGGKEVRFPLHPFMGMTGVAFSNGTALNDPSLNSIPPNLGGGNIDINLLTAGSTFYLPVYAEGALFYTGDPHMAMGNGEAALTAMEGSVRATFRLTVCKRGSGDAPSVAFHYPFAETRDAWVPIGLSDPGSTPGSARISDLNIAMRRAVVNALDFLQNDLGMDRAVAYAYLSAAADFNVSQVVDRTTGVHGVIQKSHFAE